MSIVTSVNNDTPILPSKFELAQNYPNPFSEITSIPYKLNEESKIEISIYNILGQEVRKFNIGEQQRGIYEIQWDGRNSYGVKVVPGIYFYKLQAENEKYVKKMITGFGYTALNSSADLPSIHHLLKYQKYDLNMSSETFNIKITNTDTTEPKINMKELTGIKIQNDTSINITVEPVEDEILYIEDIEGSYDRSIYLMDIEGSYNRKITDSVSDYARWSPDGQWIAFHKTVGENDQIFIIRADGTGKRIITLWEVQGRIEKHPDGGVYPVWSPDGERIAFSRCVSCEIGVSNYEIFVINVDTSKGIKETRLTNSYVADGILDWSWAANKILFETDSTDDNRWNPNLYIMNPDGTAIEKIQIDNTIHIGDIRFSQDGSLLAFVNTMDWEIYIMNNHGSNIKKVTNLHDIIRGISWSPDGERLIFKVGPPVNGGQLYIINKDGTGLRQITSGEDKYMQPDWRPKIK